jgi:Flp pilus assembly protein TadB
MAWLSDALGRNIGALARSPLDMMFLAVFGSAVAVLVVMSSLGSGYGRTSVGVLAVAGLFAYVAAMLVTSTVTEFRQQE